MSNEMAYNSLDGSLWVFPDGPNHAGQYLGCADSDAIDAPEGAITLTMCFTGKGKWQTGGKKKAPPEAVTTTITTLTYRQRNYLEKLHCEFGLMYLQNEGGRSDLFCNHQRAIILDGVNITGRTIDNILKREENNETTHAFAISANPPPIETALVEGNRKTVLELSNFNDVFMIKGDCAPCLEGVAVADGTGVYSASQVWLTHDGGQTWTITPTSPFFAAQDLTACALVDMCNDIRRIIVSQEPPGAAQGHTAYSDDDGATWTEVHIGGAAAGHGAVNGLFALDSRHIWLASVNGYIYFSDDGGETWTAQESAVITAGDYYKVAFMEDGLHGYACAESGVVAKTTNGGASWTACTLIAGTPDLHALAVTDDDHAWVGDENGALWFTEDSGLTWTQRTGFVGSAAGDIQAISFVNDWVGFMIEEIGATGASNIYRTIDGGYSWDVLTADPNATLNALVGCDENYAVVVGDIITGYGFIGVVEE
jgi:photosystem II stability/assembly factor-like uncharacterized protein